MPVYEFTELEAVKPLRQNAYPAKDQEGNPVEETLPRINYWGFKKAIISHRKRHTALRILCWNSRKWCVRSTQREWR